MSQAQRWGGHVVPPLQLCRRFKVVAISPTLLALTGSLRFFSMTTRQRQMKLTFDLWIRLCRARMSMVDGFPYKEEVGGSSPSAPTKCKTGIPACLLNVKCQTRMSVLLLKTLLMR